MRTLRFPLLVVATMVALVLGCSTVADLFSEDNAGTMPGTVPPGGLPPGIEPGTPELMEPTSDVQRLERRPTATPFYVTSEEDPRAVLDLPNPTHNDFFDDPLTWFRYDDEGYAAYEVDDGRLLATDYAGADRPIYWSYTSFSSGNVYAEVSATFGECYGRDVVGFVIRVQAEQTPSGYSLEVSCDGAWRFRRLRPAQLPFEMVDWTSSDLIETGEGGENRLGIWGYHGQFYLFINGTQVGEARDAGYTYELGFFAVYVQSQEAVPLRGSFDDFAYWNIPYQP